MLANGEGRYGYTVEDILPLFLSNLDAALLVAGKSAELIVRPHPSESDVILKEIVSSTHLTQLRTQVRSCGTDMDNARISHAVFGMMTIALLKAALIDKPAVSIEIGLRESGEDDPCVPNTLGYTLGVFDRESLRKVCNLVAREDWATLRQSPKHDLHTEGATAKVADIIESTLMSCTNRRQAV